MQENGNPQPAFLQNRILAQVKSRRWFNRFRILHGRLMSARQRDDEGAAGVYDRYPAETPSSLWLVKSLLKT
jgi:hypothetical protein